MLELVAFCDQCDQRFDEMQTKFATIIKKEKHDFDDMKASYFEVKTSIASTVKNLLVDVDDSKLRDHLLNVLTAVSEQPIHQSVNQVINQIISRMLEVLNEKK